MVEGQRRRTLNKKELFEGRWKRRFIAKNPIGTFRSTTETQRKEKRVQGEENTPYHRKFLKGQQGDWNFHDENEN